MKRRLSFHISFCIVALLLSLVSLPSRADEVPGTGMKSDPQRDLVEKRIIPNDHHYPSMIRATILAQAALPDGPPRVASGGAQATAEFGQGLVSAEAGLAFLSMRTNLLVTDSTGSGKNSHSEVDHFVGVPIFLKVNYIERPQYSFSGKLGVMPIVSTKNTSKLNVGDSAGQTYNLKGTDALAEIGFTGAAEVGDKTEFVIDGSYGRGLTNLDGNGGHHAVIEVGVGIRFDL